MSTLCTVAHGRRQSNSLLGVFLIAAALLIVSLPSEVEGQFLPLAFQWPMGGHDLRNRGNQPFTTIGISNVNQLTTKWVFTTTAGSVSATPAVVNGVVYFPDWPPLGADGYFYAVDATTGQLIWSHKISDWTGVPGDFARDDPAFNQNKIILGDQGGQLAGFLTTSDLSGPGATVIGPGAKVIEVNADNGQLVWVTQVDISPAAMITGSPVVFNGVVYVGYRRMRSTSPRTPPILVARFEAVSSR